MTGAIRITCVSDEEGLAEEVYKFLYAQLEKHQQFEEGKNLHITPALVRLDANNNEIHIDESANVPEEMVKWILELYLKSDSRFKDYGVIQFENTFTVGKLMPATEMGIYTCELCSYSTLYQEELNAHRMMHYFGVN